MTALLDFNYVSTSIHQELHSRAAGTLVETQDVGAGAEAFGIDAHLMLAFGEAAQTLVHHHAARHVEDLIADIAAFIEVEAEGSLTADRVRIHRHVH